jgi:hypothetical protein
MTATIKTQIRAVLGMACVASVLWGGFAQAAPRKVPAQVVIEEEANGTEPWIGQRVLLLLPLQLGAGWNLDKKKSEALLPAAEAKLQLALQRTGKFSTTQLHRYNPLILRGVQEKLYTKEQADALIATPSLDGLQKALAPMRFEQPPLIAVVTLDEVATQPGQTNTDAVLTATGKLYEVDSPTPIREVIVTSRGYSLFKREKRKGKQVLVRLSPRERLMSAADSAFGRIAEDFVRPIDDISWPESLVTLPTGAVIVPNGTPGTQVYGTFDVPQR